MKRVGIIVLVFVFGMSAFSACATMKTTNKALMQEVKAKVAEMQELVKFDDKQAKKLEKVELKFLEKNSWRKRAKLRIAKTVMLKNCCENCNRKKPTSCSES